MTPTFKMFLCLLLVGCSASLGQSTPTAAQEITPHMSNAKSNASTKPDTGTLGDGSESLQDKNGLKQLIKLKSKHPSPVEAEHQYLVKSNPSISENIIETQFSKVTVPPAAALWQLSDTKCTDILTEAGIQYHVPKFATPFVKMPLLLDSKIEGVAIDTKWPTDTYRRVMDCRLIVSLIQLARRAAEKGVVKIDYYSTWRPIKSLEKCAKGKKGKKCRAVYEKAQQGHLPSQHSRATAIDIRWFTFNDGSTIDVLEHYEMNFHEPPCDDMPITDEGKFLMEFACTLHEDKAFNVMLTPNADRDHENHFHFDITPNVKWYIIR